MHVTTEPVQTEYIRHLACTHPALEDQLADIYQVLTAVSDGGNLREESPLDSARAAYIAYLREESPDVQPARSRHRRGLRLGVSSGVYCLTASQLQDSGGPVRHRRQLRVPQRGGVGVRRPLPPGFLAARVPVRRCLLNSRLVLRPGLPMPEVCLSESRDQDAARSAYAALHVLAGGVYELPVQQ